MNRDSTSQIQGINGVYKIESFKGIYILTKTLPCGKIACVKMSYDKNLIYNMKMRLENDVPRTGR